MRKVLYMLLMAIFAICISGCKSEIEKQAEIVKKLAIETTKADIKRVEVQL